MPPSFPQLPLAAGLCAALLLIAIPSFAGERSCEEENAVRSWLHNQRASITFTNDRATEASLFWLDYEGKRRPYGVVKPGVSASIASYVTHPWLLADSIGRCLAVIVADGDTVAFHLRSDTATKTAYEALVLEGWQVRINSDLVRFAPDIKDQALALLQRELANVRRVIPPRHVVELQKVWFWIEANDGPKPNLFYNDNSAALRRIGKSQDKLRHIELTNAASFVDSESWEPWVVLHELSHAYHAQVIGYADTTIGNAYRNAVAHHLYEQVAHYDGKITRAYALTNDREYFAELTEAYFGRNDFFPFDRAELAVYDPVGFKMIQQLWEER